MNQQIQTFLDTVCQQVKYQEVHDEIRLELRSHLDELVEKYVSSGIAETDAVNAALADMGDPVLIGQQLNKTHQPQTEWGLIIATLLLVLLGCWAMYAVEIGMGPGLRAGFFTHKLLWSGVGLALGAALLFFDYRRLRRYSSVLYVAALVVPALVDELGLVPHLQQRLINYTPILFAVALAGIVIWNLLMTVGLLPVAGVDLPFISYGMQGAVQLALVGLVLGVFRQKEIIRSPALPQ